MVSVCLGSPPEKFSLVWKYNVPQPIFSSVAVSSGSVYFGSLDSCFYALDIASGKQLWKFKTTGEIRSTALVENKKIYFISGDGNLYCLSDSGKLIWKFRTKGEKKVDFADYHQSAAVLKNGLLFFGSGDSCIYAVHAGNGSLKWVFKTGDAVHSTPAIDDQAVYCGSFDGYCYAISIDNGALLWKFKTVGHHYFPKGEVQGSPAQTEDLVFFGVRDYNVYALDKKEGYCHWNRSFSKGWVLSLTILDSVLYMAGADERMLAAVNPNTGTEYWKRSMDFLVFGNVVKMKEELLIGTTMGKLYAIDLNTGSDKCVFSTSGYNKSRLKYFKENDEYRDDIYSIITSNEQFLEVECELGGIFSTPVCSDNYVVFSSAEGAVYCLSYL
ncbi:MAG: PQQ-binding-like beta-propeller repeat protein [Bacteroidetes bacterium]|nr:PQQ-binding-like beta-propeller repeat protein [Bacteroidota bacterium]